MYSLWIDTSLCPGNNQHIVNSACIRIAYGLTPVCVLVIQGIEHLFNGACICIACVLRPVCVQVILNI